jgi:hypothetical protein
MYTGSDLLETWIPDGGFEIAKRRLKTGDGGSAVADCLVPKWPDDELARDLPCARQPCLHRIFAECPPDPQRILSLAGRYGLLTVSIPRTPAPGHIVKADLLPPEPVEIWRKEIQALRACTELCDSIANGRESAAAREHLSQRIAEHLARVPFHLKVSEQGFRYCPVNLSAALWQRFAAEVAGLIHPVRCGRAQLWSLVPARNHRSQHKRFCSNACKNRAFRRTEKNHGPGRDDGWQLRLTKP